MRKHVNRPACLDYVQFLEFGQRKIQILDFPRPSEARSLPLSAGAINDQFFDGLASLAFSDYLRPQKAWSFSSHTVSGGIHGAVLAFEKGIEVNGQTILSVVKGAGVFEQSARKFLAKYGLIDVQDSGEV